MKSIKHSIRHSTNTPFLLRINARPEASEGFGDFRNMSPRRMLSRRQCVFVIVVLPLLIIPAFIVLKHADGGLTEVFIPPTKPSKDGKETRQVQRVNITAVQRYMKLPKQPLIKPPVMVKPKPRKCFDYIWTGTCRDTCFNFNIAAKQRQRKQTVLKCDSKRSQLKIQYTTKAKYVYKAPFQDECLRKVLDWYCQDGKGRVPNIVHYVWFGKNEFTFINFLSFLSVHKFQNPCLILLHADKMPKGKMWTYFLQINSKVIQVFRKQPKKIFTKKLSYVEHKADIAKLEALKEYGGIYLDTDQILLKPVDKFLTKDATIGLDYATTAANSIIIAKRNAPFIKLWYESYRTYDKIDGNEHSQRVPFKLAEKYRGFVQLAGDLISYPNVHQLSALYARNVDWSDKYGMHMHSKLRDRFFKDKVFTLESIKSLNTTAGAVARYIIYGNTDLCMAKTVIQ